MLAMRTGPSLSVDSEQSREEDVLRQPCQMRSVFIIMGGSSEGAASSLGNSLTAASVLYTESI